MPLLRLIILGILMGGASLMLSAQSTESAQSAQSTELSAPLAEPFRMQWRASNSVWLRGPAISYLQAQRQEYAIGSYPEADLSAWQSLVPQNVRDAVERERPEIASLQRYEPQQQAYLRDGSVIGQRVALTSADGDLRGEAEVFAGDPASWVRVYDSSERLLLEIEFDGRDIVYIDRLRYRDNSLEQRERSMADGTQIYSDRYSYRANGALRLVERESPDGVVRSSQYSFHDYLLRGEVHTMPDSRVMQIRYDEFGRIAHERSYNDGELAEETRFSYSGDDDSRPEGAVTSFGSSDRRVERSYRDGLETRVLEYDGDEVQREVQFRYNDSRLLVERVATADETVTREEFRYGSEDVLVEERVLRDDVIRERRILLEAVTGDMAELSETIAALEVPEGATEILFLYSEGELALRVYFDEQQRIKEEVIHAGEIERVRQFRSRE